jgi:hypothetical protein
MITDVRIARRKLTCLSSRRVSKACKPIGSCGEQLEEICRDHQIFGAA